VENITSRVCTKQHQLQKNKPDSITAPKNQQAFWFFADKKSCDCSDEEITQLFNITGSRCSEKISTKPGKDYVKHVMGMLTKTASCDYASNLSFK